MNHDLFGPAQAQTSETPAEGQFVISRESAELEYHARVLASAANPDLPLLDRVRFLSFFTSLTDEFFRIRVARIHEDIAAGNRVAENRAKLSRLHERFTVLSRWQRSLWEDQIRPALGAEGIHTRRWNDLNEQQREVAAEWFRREMFPMLTPLAVGPAHPFPFISDLSLSIGVVLDTADSGPAFARVKVPTTVDRLVCVSENDEGITFTRAEEIIGAHIDELFPGRTVKSWHLFRVTRDADYALDDPDIDDLVAEVESELRDRQFGRVVRLEVEESMPRHIVRILRSELKISYSETMATQGPPSLEVVGELFDIDRNDLKSPPVRGRSVKELSDDRIFARLREGDLMVHHPYDSFASSTQQFIETASADPRVLAIKQTLYRTGGDSPIVQSMMRAVENGKQAAMLVELKARFDEEANLSWAERLQAAGVHVVHGFVELKTHTKTALIVRRDEDGYVRSYGHVGTGNYNSKTARFYEDLGVFTADPVITHDLADLFNMLTSQSPQLRPKKLLIAPTTLKERILDGIKSQSHEAGRIILKTNHLSHTEVIDALVAASQAGANIDLIVRTTNCLVPGVEGKTDNIRVRAVNGPTLEHSRIYKFGKDPEPGYFLVGSADLMPRNLDNRVEAMLPVDDPDLRQHLDDTLDELLADERWSWTQNSDATWTKVHGDRDCQQNMATLNPREI